jgi:hypothetical protein
MNCQYILNKYQEYELIFTNHAAFKIQERKIDKDLINDVLRNPDYLFFDKESNSCIAIKRVLLDSEKETNFILAFNIEKIESNSITIKIITCYPCKSKKLKKQINKKVAEKRWLKINI